jgi:hypothetical protein
LNKNELFFMNLKTARIFFFGFIYCHPFTWFLYYKFKSNFINSISFLKAKNKQRKENNQDKKYHKYQDEIEKKNKV